MFDSLDLLPPDPLLGLMAAYRADPRDNKIDLGVGVYKDERGLTPIMHAVKSAEERLLRTEQTKVYEGPRGNVLYCAEIERLVFGDSLDQRQSRLSSFTTPGGCGALYLALKLFDRVANQPTVWISDPSWPNHRGVAEALGLQVNTYPYPAGFDVRVDVNAIIEQLSFASPGDVIIIQGPCHNPTGIDLAVDEWRELAQAINRLGLNPVIDIAYHGLGSGLQDDLSGVLCALDYLPTVCISYSCSKNFGLYRERTGCLIALSSSAESREIVASHIADIARSSYSMPPSHGAAIVQTILSDAELRSSWETELAEMRQRIRHLRDSLADRLNSQIGGDVCDAIKSQKGMFSKLPIAAEHALELRNNESIYLPGSGRVNIAGMDVDQVARIAQCLASALRSN